MVTERTHVTVDVKPALDREALAEVVAEVKSAVEAAVHAGLDAALRSRTVRD